MNYLHKTTQALAALVVLNACSENPEPAATVQILATVGDETLTVSHFETAMQQRGVRPDDPATKQALLDELVAHLKLVHVAKQRGYDQHPDVIRSHENALIARLQRDFESN